MLDERGRIDSAGELMDLLEQLWCSYEEAQGPAQSAQERLVGLAYLATVLRQDADAIAAQLLASPELEPLDVVGALQAELGAPDENQAIAIKAELERRGWTEQRHE